MQTTKFIPASNGVTECRHCQHQRQTVSPALKTTLLDTLYSYQSTLTFEIFAHGMRWQCTFNRTSSREIRVTRPIIYLLCIFNKPEPSLFRTDITIRGETCDKKQSFSQYGGANMIFFDVKNNFYILVLKKSIKKSAPNIEKKLKRSKNLV